MKTLSVLLKGKRNAVMCVISAGTVLAGMPALGQGIPITSPSTLPDFGMIGGAPGQILRLNVTSDPGSQCMATLGFRDSLGNPIGPTGRAVVTGRQVTSLDLNFASLDRGAGGRVELQPVVQVLDPSLPCHASAEIYDAVSQRTLGLQPPPVGDRGAAPPPVGDRGAQPPPIGDRGTLGVVTGQTVRLSLVRQNPPPVNDRGITPPPINDVPGCTALMGIATADGSVRVATIVNLSPGQSMFIDAPMGPAAAVVRSELTPFVQPISPNSADGCIASVQVFDQATGWTQLVSR